MSCPEPCYELHGGKWSLAKLSSEEPEAVVVYATEPSPETGHAGWCWWALGAIGEASSAEAAMEAAESRLRARAK